MKLLIALIVSCLIPMPVKQTIKVKIKKVVPLVFALLFLCPFLSYASGPQVLAIGTATLANSKLSLAANYAFFDFGVDLTAFVGEQIEICAATAPKYCIRGIISTVGTGETLSGSELFTNANFDLGDTGWTKEAGWTIVDQGAGDYEGVATNSGVNLRVGQVITNTIGVLYKGSFVVTNYTSGRVAFRTNPGPVEMFGTQLTGTGTSTLYFTGVNGAGSSTGPWATQASTTLRVDDCTLQQVVTPSATGHWIKSAPGATDGVAWSYKHASFNPNDSAGFTYRILSTNIPGKQIASGTVSATDVKLATVDGGAMVEITGVDLSPYAGVDSYSPPSTNLQLHLKADAGCFTDAGKTTACASDSDKAYVWEDQSGNGNDAVQATEGYRPLWKTNIVGTLPAIRFAGTDDNLAVSAAISQPITIYSVHKVSNTEHNGILGSSRETLAVHYNNAYGTGLWLNSAFMYPTKNYGSSKSLHTFYANGSGTKIYTMGMRGEQAINKNTGLTSPFYIGFNGYAYLIGDIYEILIYNTAHDDITRTQIERYLAGKWGISYTPTVYGTSPAKYLLCLYDSSSRVACGYVGAAGGGESLGSELMTGGWTNSDFESFSSSGTDITSAVNSSSSGTAFDSGGQIGTVWGLHKAEVNATINSGSGLKVSFGGPGWFPYPNSVAGRVVSSGAGSYYLTAHTFGWFGVHSQSNVDFSATGMSLKRVTDIATTGVHLHSTPNATDRKMSLKTTGFDPNSVTKYKIYRTY